MKDSIVILSGGMDSTTLLHYVAAKTREAGKSPHSILAVSFDYGQRLAKELECAKHQTHLLNIEHLVIDIKPLAAQMFLRSALTDSSIPVPNVQAVMGDPQPVTYVPNRNLLFLEIATAIAESNGAKAVFYGAQKHDVYGYWDTTPDFLHAVRLVHALNRKNHVAVEAPFVEYSKADILRLDEDMGLGIDYNATWSCYNGMEAACGKCATCAERIAAFKKVHRIDPIPYAVDIDWES